MKTNKVIGSLCLLATALAAGFPTSAPAAGPTAKVLVGCPSISHLSGGDNAVVIAVDGMSADVRLDGSMSSDPEGDPLGYLWMIDGVAAGSGPQLRARLDLGPHQVLLMVNDAGSTASDTLGVEVISGTEAVEALTDCLSASGLPAGKRKPLANTLKDAGKEYGKAASDYAKELAKGKPGEAAHKLSDRVRQVVEKLKEFQRKVESEKNGLSRAMAEKLIGLAQDLINCSQPAQEPAKVPNCEPSEGPNIIVFTYNGQGCEQSTNAQISSGKSTCRGSPNGAMEVGITVKDKNNPLAPSYFVGRVQLGQMFEVQASAMGQERFKDKLYFFIYMPDGRTLLQKVQIDTSCSSPLRRGDTFGSLELVDYLNLTE